MKDYLRSNIKNDKEIKVDLYSKTNGFVLPIDLSHLGDIKTTIKVLSDSQSIYLKIKKRYQLFYKTIEMKPNFQIVLPDIVPRKSEFSNMHILDIPTTTPVPISVSLFTMKREGDSYCNAGPTGGGKANKLITTYESVQNFGCPTDINEAQKCGIKCWSETTNYSYTFKGVKFAVYGTKDTNHKKFDIELDGNYLTEINEEI